MPHNYCGYPSSGAVGRSIRPSRLHIFHQRTPSRRQPGWSVVQEDRFAGEITGDDRIEQCGQGGRQQLVPAVL